LETQPEPKTLSRYLAVAIIALCTCVPFTTASFKLMPLFIHLVHSLRWNSLGPQRKSSDFLSLSRGPCMTLTLLSVSDRGCRLQKKALAPRKYHELFKCSIYMGHHPLSHYFFLIFSSLFYYHVLKHYAYVLIVQKDFIVIFPYMHTIYFDQIHPFLLFLISSLPFLKEI
jgi:hypothetical protein